MERVKVRERERERERVEERASLFRRLSKNIKILQQMERG